MKNRFIKNLFQILSFTGSVLVIEFPLVYVLIVTFPMYGFVFIYNFLLIMAISLPVFAFACGFYWIFQNVLIDENGITIYFFKKVLKNIKWTEVLYICYDNRFKNPEIKIMGPNNCIHLDERKAIIRAINNYSQTYFGDEINHLKQ